MKRHIITGGLGFLGSHLALRLARRGDHVTILDLPGGDDRLLRALCRSIEIVGPNEYRPTSQDLQYVDPDNMELVRSTGRISVVRGNATSGSDLTGALAVSAQGQVGVAALDTIWSFACHASPDRYKQAPVTTLRACSEGTHAAVDLAIQTGAKLVLASTSEVYGDPAMHPQPESYRGNVDPTGPRSMYDEGKRYAEAYVTATLEPKQRAIVRIFNTIGPCSLSDGRMIPSFVRQAIALDKIHVDGDGTQTRSPIYVSDLLDGIEVVVDKGDGRPYNVGGEEEMSVGLVAHNVASLFRFTYGRKVEVVTGNPRCEQDPSRRLPDLSRVRAIGWKGPRLLAGSAIDRAASWLIDHAPAYGWKPVIRNPGGAS
mgnify:CR=1 FL=1